MGHVYFSVMINAFVSLRKSLEWPEDCCCSVTQSCPTLCDPMDYSMPGFFVLHCLLAFAQTHVHWVSDAIPLFHPLLSPSPAFNLSLASGSFTMSQLFAQGGHSIGASASVLPSVLRIVIYICFFLFSSIFFKLKEFSHLNLWSSRNDFSVWCEFPFLFYVFIFILFFFVLILFISTVTNADLSSPQHRTNPLSNLLHACFMFLINISASLFH